MTKKKMRRSLSIPIRSSNQTDVPHRQIRAIPRPNPGQTIDPNRYLLENLVFGGDHLLFVANGHAKALTEQSDQPLQALQAREE